MTAKNRRFSYDVLLIFCTRVLIFPINLLVGIITARYLGPHDRGIYSFLLIVPQSLELFFRFGIPQANIYMIRREKIPAYCVSGNSVVYGMVFGTIITMFSWLLGDKIPAIFGLTIPPRYVFMMSVSAVFYLFNAYFISIFNALGRFDITNLFGISSSMISLLAVYLILVKLEYTLIAVLGAIVSTVFVTTLIMFVVCAQLTNFKLNFDWPLAKSTLQFGIKSYFQTLTQHLHLRVDMYMIALFMDPKDIAFYSIASRLAELLLIVEHSIGTVLYPKLTSVNPEMVHEVTMISLRHAIFVVSLAALGLVFFGKMIIVGWYGMGYVEAVMPFFVILPGIVMLTIFYTLGSFFTTLKKQEVNTICALMALCINIVLNYILIPRIGIVGAALSSTISYSFAALTILLWFKKTARIKLWKVVHFRRKDVMIYYRTAKNLLNHFV